MNYRELLNYCKDKPGCLSTNRQIKMDSNLKYRSWLDISKIDNNKK